MHHARHDHAVDIGEDVSDGFAVFGRVRWQLRADCSWRRRRRDADIANVLPVIRDPIRNLMQMPAEFCWIDIA
jgi:hypothetical protein